MPFARIPALRAFPGRATHIRGGVVDTPLTIHLNPVTKGDPTHLEQLIEFVEVSAGQAELLSRVGFFGHCPASPHNPPRVEIVATREEATAIEARDRATIDRAGGQLRIEAPR